MSADYQDGVVGADDADETEPSYGEDCVDDANAMSRMKRMTKETQLTQVMSSSRLERNLSTDPTRTHATCNQHIW